MELVFSCLRQAHDPRLLLAAALICIVGIHASFSIGMQAGRSQGQARRTWACVSIVASASTAWATHMIALLAFQPGMRAAFDPTLTAFSFVCALLGIGGAVFMAIGRRDLKRRFVAGLVLGSGVAALHYLGQASYLVTGAVSWNNGLVLLSLLVGLPLHGGAMVVAGLRRRSLRRLAPPLLLFSIAVLHVLGMSALELTFDPTRRLPDNAIPLDVMSPIVVVISLGLLTLAFVGLRLTQAARVRRLGDQERLRALTNVALEGLLVCEGDDDTIVAANVSLETLSGFEPESLTGGTLAALLPGLTLHDLPEREERDAELVGADGQLVPVRVLRREVHVGSRRQTIVAIRDQRERLRTESKIRHLAFTDPLTNLPNRSRFNDLLSVYCAASGAETRRFALLLLDLDRFKWVNDTMGHGIGDELLRCVGARLNETVGGAGIVARLGGDEFAVLAPIVDGDAAISQLGDRIVEQLAQPFDLDGQWVDVAGSVGVAFAPDDANEASDLTRRADLALYRAKRDGGGLCRFFEREMDESAQARHSLEQDLRLAVARQDFEVYYQPQVDPASGVFKGAEALVRWTHPTRGAVSPVEFIPLAEEIGLVGAIGEWVLRTACDEARSWPATSSVAVNLSAVQLRTRQLALTVASILGETGLAGSRLELEVTESALMQDDGVTYANLHMLRALGVRIALDDFGTGYSSLSYLRRFPFDKIKIDQSFVAQVPRDPGSVAIVQAITGLAAKLGMSVTVEGVETEEQRVFAVSENCEQIQGYLIGAPMPVDEIRRLALSGGAQRHVA